MKRFQSPFQKIQRIQQQQLRIAELKLRQAQAVLKTADENIRQRQEQYADVERNHVNQLAGTTQTLRSEVVHAVRAHLEQCRSDLVTLAKQRELLNAACMDAMAAWRRLNARCDGVDQLIRNRKYEYRRHALLNEQTELDESARALSTVQEFRSDRDSGGATKDGVTLR